MPTLCKASILPSALCLRALGAPLPRRFFPTCSLPAAEAERCRGGGGGGRGSKVLIPFLFSPKGLSGGFSRALHIYQAPTLSIPLEKKADFPPFRSSPQANANKACLVSGRSQDSQDAEQARLSPSRVRPRRGHQETRTQAPGARTR